MQSLFSFDFLGTTCTLIWPPILLCKWCCANCSALLQTSLSLWPFYLEFFLEVCLFLFGWSLVFKWLFCWNCSMLLLAANSSFTSSRVIPFQFKGLQTSLSLRPFYLEFFLEICLVGHRFYRERNYWICYFCWPPILLYK